MGSVFEFFKCSLGEEEKICEKVVIYGLLKRIFLILNNENYLNISCKAVSFCLPLAQRIYLPVSIIPLFYDNFVLFRSLKYTMSYHVFDYFFNEKKNEYIKRQTYSSLICFQNTDISVTFLI